MPKVTSDTTAHIGVSLALKASVSQGSRRFWTSSYMKSTPAMSPVVASDHSDMKRRSSRKARMSRMVRPIWRERKFDAFTAPAETPQMPEKPYAPRSCSTSSTPAVNIPRKPPPSSTSAGATTGLLSSICDLLTPGNDSGRGPGGAGGREASMVEVRRIELRSKASP